MVALLLLLLSIGTSAAASSSAAAEEDDPAKLLRLATIISGPDSSELDLWRAEPGADKVHVLARLPDGSRELFLLDTGSSVTVLHTEIAERLGLTIRTMPGLIQGLGGTSAWRVATLPSLTIGGFELSGVDVAVGVPGAPDSAGPLPVAGILGNNVWGNFILEVDYPADILALHRAGRMRLPADSSRLTTDLLRAQAVVDVVTAVGTRQRIQLELDTGARDLIFVGNSANAFRSITTVGVEPVLGIGASLDDLPMESFLRETRRVPVRSVGVGGRRVQLQQRSRWFEPDAAASDRPDTAGLLGYVAFARGRAVFDFPGRRFALLPSRRPARVFEAARAWLEVEQKDHPGDPARAATRARLQHAGGDVEGARRTLAEGLAARPADAEIATLLAWLSRIEGDLEGALDILASLPPTALAEEHAWIGYVDGLVVAGRMDQAVQAAERALAEARPDDPDASDLLVALSDALLAAGRPDEAAAAIEEAGQLAPRGSAHLLRKARIAAASGDRFGAMVALSTLIELNPLDGTPLWLYAQLADRAEVPELLALVERARRRVHPGDEPLDFIGATLIGVGQLARGAEALTNGRTLDCLPLSDGPDRDNCEAWYAALNRPESGGAALAEARARVDRAIAASPWNPAYHDTAAMVACADGRLDDAKSDARAAARLSPDDPYLLWQLARMSATLESPSIDGSGRSHVRSGDRGAPPPRSGCG